MGRKLKKLVAIAMICSIGTNSVAFAAPSEIYGFKTIKKWDYHKVNYDKDGNIRYKPKTSEFDTDNENQSNVDYRIPKLSVKETRYGENVEITYNISDVESKQWEDNIYRVTRVDDESENPNLEQDVNFKVMNGKIILYSDSRPIDSNGIHGIKIYSNGHDSVIKNIHIVEKAPTIKIHPDYKPLVDEDIVLELYDFNYAITNPIYEVLVDGKKLEGNCEDYHVISNLIRIENSGKIKTEGEHTITVKAYGYEDASITLLFRKGKIYNIGSTEEEHHKAKDLPKVSIKNHGDIYVGASFSKSSKRDEVDIITSASKKPESGDNDTKAPDAVTGASGSLDTPVNLVFDFEMVSNAYILKALGIETKESKDVLRQWESADKDGAKAEESERIVSWKDYINEVERAKVDENNKNRHITFKDYVNMPSAEDYLNRPYSVKYVLEDGLYGDVIRYGEIDDIDSPQISKKGYYNLNENIVLNYEDEKWAENIKEVIVGNMTLRSGEYSVKDGKITIRSYRFTKGINNIRILSKGYKDSSIEVKVQNNNINLRLEEEQKIGQAISIVGTTKDYVRNIKSVILDGKMLLSNEATGNDGDYSIQMDKILLDKDLIKDSHNHILLVKAYGYEDSIVKIALKDSNSNENEEANVVPEFVVESVIEGEDITIKLVQDNSKWRGAIENIEVNDTKVHPLKWSHNKNTINIDGSLFKVGENIINIQAKGYDDKSIAVTVTEKQIEEAVNEPRLEIVNEPSIKEDVYIDILLENNKDYSKWFKNAVVKLNGKIMNENAYAFEKNGDLYQLVIKKNLSENVFGEGEIQKVEIESAPYETAVVEFRLKKESLKDAPGISHNNHMIMNSEFKINANDWTNNLTEVKVKIGEEVRVLEEGTDYYSDRSNSAFIIKSHNLNKEGNATLSFKSQGYKDSEFTIMLKPLYDVPSDVRLLGEAEIERATGIQIGLPQGFLGFGKDYKVKDVYVNGEKLENNKYNVGILAVEIFEEAFVKKGEYEIVLKSDKYKDAIFNIKVLNDMDISPEIEEKQAPIIVSDSVGNLPLKDVEVTFDENEEWRNNISEIKINNESVDLNKVKKSSGKLILSGQLFRKSGVYEIVILSSGYSKSMITQEIKEEPATIVTDLKDGSEVQNSKFKFNATVKTPGEIIPEKAVVKFNNEEIQAIEGTFSYEVILSIGENIMEISDENNTINERYVITYTEKVVEQKDVPKGVTLRNKGTLLLNQDIKILVKDFMFKDYRDAITDIYVDGTSVNVNYIEGTHFQEIMVIDKSNFSESKTYTIQIKAEGYKDFAIDVVIEELEEKPEKLIESPVIKDGKVSLLGTRCDIKNYSEVWKDNVYEVTVNGQVTESYTIYLLAVENGEFKFENPAELEVGDNIIVIKSTGYNPVTFKIVK